jgi:Uma2 family endonuclease
MTTHQTIMLGPEFAGLTDDTEESILGSSLHQGAITTLDDGLNACGPQRGLPWFVGNQIRMIIPRQEQRVLYLSPDILVHPTLGSGSRDSIVVAADGPPALAIEVASPSTALGRDLNEDAPDAKPAAYAALGILEYIVFDPVGEFLPDRVRAWQMGPGGYVPWGPERTGRWMSRALDISFAPHGFLLRVYDQEGQLVPLSSEARSRAALLGVENERLRTQQGELRTENQRLRELANEAAARAAVREREIAALQAELRRLRGE